MSDRSIESRADQQLVSAMRFVGALFFLLTAGCAWLERAPSQTGAPQGETVVVEPSMSRSTEQGIPRTDLPDAKTTATVPAEQPGKKPGVISSTGKPVTPPLDLTALETRLKETNAIGVFTKITLKNQVDDLLEQFRAHYQGRTKTSLAELRQPYDRLLLKVLTLLQDGDPELARAVVTSREAIWGILADPARFAAL